MRATPIIEDIIAAISELRSNIDSCHARSAAHIRSASEKKASCIASLLDHPKCPSPNSINFADEADSIRKMHELAQSALESLETYNQHIKAISTLSQKFTQHHSPAVELMQSQQGSEQEKKAISNSMSHLKLELLATLPQAIMNTADAFSRSQENIKLDFELTQTRERLKQAEHKSSQERARLNESIKQLTETLRAKTQQIQTTDSTLRKAENQLDEQKKIIQKYKEDTKESLATIKDMKQENQALHTTTELFESMQRKLENKLDKQRNQLDKQRKTIQKHERNMKKSSAKIIHMEQENQALYADNVTLKNMQLQLTNALNLEYEQRYKHQHDAQIIADLQAQLSSNHDAMEALSIDSRTQQNINESLRQEKTSLTQRIVQLKDRLNVTTEANKKALHTQYHLVSTYSEFKHNLSQCCNHLNLYHRLYEKKDEGLFQQLGSEYRTLHDEYARIERKLSSAIQRHDCSEITSLDSALQNLRRQSATLLQLTTHQAWNSASQPQYRKLCTDTLIHGTYRNNRVDTPTRYITRSKTPPIDSLFSNRGTLRQSQTAKGHSPQAEMT